MTIVEAFKVYHSEEFSDNDRGDLLIRRTNWKHGRVIIPGKYDIYATCIGKYPMMPVPCHLEPSEIMADNWEVTNRQIMSFPPVPVSRPQRTGRRKVVTA